MTGKAETKRPGHVARSIGILRLHHVVQAEHCGTVSYRHHASLDYCVQRPGAVDTGNTCADN